MDLVKVNGSLGILNLNLNDVDESVSQLRGTGSGCSATSVCSLQEQLNTLVVNTSKNIQNQVCPIHDCV